MDEGIPLLPPPTEGWEWRINEVNIGGQVYFAMIQQRQPEPPAWWEVAEHEADYGHLIALLAAAAMGVGKVRAAWKRGRGQE